VTEHKMLPHKNEDKNDYERCCWICRRASYWADLPIKMK
jgi:hypothetical protein